MAKSDMHTYPCPLAHASKDAPPGASWAAVVEVNGVRFYAPTATRAEAERLHKMMSEELTKIQIEAVELNGRG